MPNFMFLLLDFGFYTRYIINLEHISFHFAFWFFSSCYYTKLRDVEKAGLVSLEM